MTHPSLVVPLHCLPPGYAQALASPPDPPAIPRPAATVALLREGEGGLEVLLLRRSRRTRFIPGAFVFPGGRVDPEDASPSILGRLDGIDAAEASARLETDGQAPPGVAYWVAALREAFEEAGILLGDEGAGIRSVPLDSAAGIGRGREALHTGRIPFHALLAEMGTRLGGDRLLYVGHWVTPVQERRRYDTRFFGAEVPRDCPAFPDGTEMEEALWLHPSEALARNRAGTLPMAFPTLHTLRALEAYESPGEALSGLSTRPIPRRLPRVEEIREGIRMTLEEGPSGQASSFGVR